MVVYYKFKCVKLEQHMYENIANEPYTMNNYIHIKTSHTHNIKRITKTYLININNFVTIFSHKSLSCGIQISIRFHAVLFWPEVPPSNHILGSPIGSMTFPDYLSYWVMIFITLYLFFHNSVRGWIGIVSRRPILHSTRGYMIVWIDSIFGLSN